ncbi:MAG: DUF4328 domain-containing protein [Akkermansiaceae bacterium]|nr:DUF4328 domain-containing protein [Akkermansiaceae bacterium]
MSELSADPYAPPIQPQNEAEEERIDLPPGTYGAYRDNRRWSVAVIALVLTLFGGNTLLIGLWSLLYILGHSFADHPFFEVTSHLLYANVLTYIAFGIWINRSAKNAWLFNGLRLRLPRLPGTLPTVMNDTPGWCVGWYFIPIASLWKPYQAMRDIFHSSAIKHPVPKGLLPLWWTFWIAETLNNNQNWELDSLAANALLALISFGISTALVVMACQLVRTLTRLQHEAAIELTLQLAQVPATPDPSSAPILTRRSSPDVILRRQ